MRRLLFSLFLFLIFIIGCGNLLDPVARKVNSVRQFEADYETWTSSTVTFTPRVSKREYLTLKTKGNKFYVKKYRDFRGSRNLEEEAVYNGKTFWIIDKEANRDVAMHIDLPARSLRCFWRLPSGRLPKPVEENLNGRPCYVYKFKSYGHGGHVEAAIYVDKKDYYIKKAESALFISDMVDEPYQVAHLECKSIVFKDIDSSLFDYKPTANAEVKTSGEALRDGLEALKTLVSGALKK